MRLAIIILLVAVCAHAQSPPMPPGPIQSPKGKEVFGGTKMVRSVPAPASVVIPPPENPVTITVSNGTVRIEHPQGWFFVSKGSVTSQWYRCYGSVTNGSKMVNVQTPTGYQRWFSAVTNPPPHMVGLIWNKSASTNAFLNAVGSRIYMGVASRTYTNIVDVLDKTNLTVVPLDGGTTYYFAATAYNIFGGESGFSDEVVYTVPPL